MKPVQGTAFDFTRPTTIGARTGPLHGIWDHCYVLKKEPGEGLALAARVTEPTSGRVMEVYTTQPGVQFYTGNPRALCLETQHYPDCAQPAELPLHVAAARPEILAGDRLQVQRAEAMRHFSRHNQANLPAIFFKGLKHETVRY